MTKCTDEEKTLIKPYEITESDKTPFDEKEISKKIYYLVGFSLLRLHSERRFSRTIEIILTPIILYTCVFILTAFTFKNSRICT